MEPELKNFGFKIEEASDDGKLAKIVGLSAAFNNVDSYWDKILKGAFLKTIATFKNWPVLRFHDPDRKVGFNAEASETDLGLRTVSHISLDTQDGKEQYALTKLALSMGGKDAQSIGYAAKAYEFEDDETHGRIRILKEVEMWEHSFVTWGANEKAFSTAVKKLKEAKSLELGDNVDAFFKHMESIGFSHKVVKDFLIKNELDEEKNRKQLTESIESARLILRKK